MTHRSTIHLTVRNGTLRCRRWVGGAHWHRQGWCWELRFPTKGKTGSGYCQPAEPWGTRWHTATSLPFWTPTVAPQSKLYVSLLDSSPHNEDQVRAGTCSHSAPPSRSNYHLFVVLAALSCPHMIYADNTGKQKKAALTQAFVPHTSPVALFKLHNFFFGKPAGNGVRLHSTQCDPAVTSPPAYKSNSSKTRHRNHHVTTKTLRQRRSWASSTRFCSWPKAVPARQRSQRSFGVGTEVKSLGAKAYAPGKESTAVFLALSLRSAPFFLHKHKTLLQGTDGSFSVLAQLLQPKGQKQLWQYPK